MISLLRTYLLKIIRSDNSDANNDDDDADDDDEMIY